MTIPLDVLERTIARPEPWAPHDAPFWDDAWIAQGMLAAHLDPGTDAASRRPKVIETIVRHLAGALPLHAGDRLLDLGCGPGLYADAFARLGVSVTGIDLSAGSIRHAQAAARAEGLAIDYRTGDYTSESLGGPFDAAVLIYLDLGVLPDGPLDRLLDGVRASLRPGGAFAFDIHAMARPRPPDAAVDVHRSDGGFWRPGPHLLIETTYRYDDDLDLAQHAVIEPDGKVTVYRVWDRAWSFGTLRLRLAAHGLRVEAAWEDLAGTPRWGGSPTMAVLARRT